MIIYVLVNSIEERVYVGQTTKSLEERVSAHWHAALKENMNTRLCQAIRRTPQREVWEAIVLQVVYDVQDLDPLEQAWIDRFDSTDGAFGYNSRVQIVTSKRRSQQRTQLEHSIDASEQFKEWGRRGAAAGKAAAASMTPERREQFREWGRLGAARAKARRASPKG